MIWGFTYISVCYDEIPSSWFLLVCYISLQITDLWVLALSSAVGHLGNFLLIACHSASSKSIWAITIYYHRFPYVLFPWHSQSHKFMGHIGPQGTWLGSLAYSYLLDTSSRHVSWGTCRLPTALIPQTYQISRHFHPHFSPFTSPHMWYERGLYCFCFYQRPSESQHPYHFSNSSTTLLKHRIFSSFLAWNILF